MQLKYGMNPNQKTAFVEDSPHLQLVNGKPSMINFLDALNSWQLVKELDAWTQKPSAASFKHVTPSGLASATSLESGEQASYQLAAAPQSGLAQAYAQARGTDRLASFGDFIALSRPLDLETAKLIKTEVSDGLIAPGFDPEALELVKNKKKGSYVIFQIDPDWIPPALEERIVFGIKLSQERNNLLLDASFAQNVKNSDKPLSKEVVESLVSGLICLKYTQSNSICFMKGTHAIGIGSGQQSRILCTGLALSKANRWYQKTLMGQTAYPENCAKTEKDQLLEAAREKLYGEEISLAKLSGTVLCSDAFFPQADNIRLAHRYGVQYIAAPMGSIRDQEILDTCTELGITFIDTGVRLFHH